MSTLNTIGLRGRNLIINGAFDFWQRGTSVTVSAAFTYLADRFSAYAASGPTITYSKETSSLPSESVSSALKLSTSGTASSGSYAVRHVVEGYNYLNISNGKKCTLSFWVKASKIGTYCVAFQGGSPQRSLVKEYTISVADTWEKKNIQFETDTAGSGWDITNGSGLTIRWTLLQLNTTTPDTWQTGDYRSTTNQVNAFDTTGNTFYLTGIMLKEGEYSNPPFERAGIDIGNELMLCQRYYETGKYAFKIGATSTATQASGIGGFVYYKVEKRIAPTPSLTQSLEAVSNVTADDYTHGFEVNGTKDVGSRSRIYSASFKADAEL